VVQSAYDPRLRLKTVVLAPGEYHATSEDVALVTLLGSCVSICLRDAATGVAGMNHYLLSVPPPSVGARRPTPGHFGQDAIPRLIAAMEKLGARREQLVAKVFGGGHILSYESQRGSIPTENVEYALARLEEHRIPVHASDVGGREGRKLFFLVRTGEVLLRRVRSIAEQEEKRRRAGGGEP
jgi:chemotaxis protein CheD